MPDQNVAFRLPIVHKFLLDLFQEAWPNVWVCGVSGDPNVNKSWGGGAAHRLGPTLSAQDNLFYSVAVVMSGRRVASEFVESRVLVIDDVGSKVDAGDVALAFGLPRWVVQTSPGSRQWVYRLAEPIKDRRIHERIMRAVAAKGWTDPGTIDAVRAMRLPAGINGKAKYGSPSPKVSVEMFEPATPDLTLAEICDALELDPIEVMDPDNYKPGTVSSVSNRVGGTADLSKPDHILKALMDLGRVLGPGREQGVVDIECPFSDEHTAREDSGTSYFGRGAVKCHHGHCVNRTNWDFKAKIRELYDAKHGAGALAAEVFCDPVDDTRVADIERAVRKATGTDRFMSWADVFARHVYLERTHNFLDVETRSFLDPVGFNAKLSGLVPFGVSGVKTATAIYVNSRENRSGLGYPEFADGVTYEPGGPAHRRDRRKGRVINVWAPGDLVLPRPGTVSDADVKLWLEHMAYLFPDAGVRETMLDWCSFVVQRPGVKINWCPLIHGAQGTGKDSAFHPVFRAAGDENVSHVMPDALEGSFTDWLKAQIIVLEEFSAFGKANTYNSLKTKIAAPPHEVRINEKFTPAYMIPNVQCYLAFSNHDDAVQFENDDRRFWVYSSPAVKRDEGYYGVLWDWYRIGGVEQVVGWLRDRKIGSSFNPSVCPPDVLGHKAAMAQRATSGAVRWVIEQFDAGGRFAGRTLVSVKEVLAAGAGVRFQGGWLSEKHVAAALKMRGGERLTENPVATNAGRVRIWSADKVAAERWTKAGTKPDDLVAAFEKEVGADV